MGIYFGIFIIGQPDDVVKPLKNEGKPADIDNTYNSIEFPDLT